MGQKFADGARTELTADITDVTTTFTVTLGDAFPVADAGTSAVSDSNDWFKAVLQDASGFEIVYVRSHTANSETFSNILRGQDGTVARAFIASSVFAVRPTAGDIADLYTRVNSKAPATSGTSILKGNGTGGFSSAVDGTDFTAPGSDVETNRVFSTSGSVRLEPTEHVQLTPGDTTVRIGTNSASIAAAALQVTPNATAGIAIEGTNSAASMLVQRASANAFAGSLYLDKARGTPGSLSAITTAGDDFGAIQFRGYGGTGYRSGALIYSEAATGTYSDTSMPGRVVIATAPNGSVAPVDRLSVESDGVVKIGSSVTATAALSIATNSSAGITVEGDSLYTSIGIQRCNASNFAGYWYTDKARGTVASKADVVANDDLGQFQFRGYGGGGFRTACSIIGKTESSGTFSSTSMPGVMLFMTTPNGSVNAVERMKIDSTGLVTVAGSLTAGGTITAPTFSGSATSIAVTDGSALASGSYSVAFTVGSGATRTVYSDSALIWNPSTNVLTATTFSGALSGNATTATTATTANALATGNNYQVNSLGVGTAGSGTAGEIRATNNITAYYSDDRLKNRLGEIDNALAKLSTLATFYYEANDVAVSLGYTKVREVGISAQQVQAILPEVVAPAPISDEYLTVRYERLIPLLIAGINELRAEVEALKNAA